MDNKFSFRNLIKGAHFDTKKFKREADIFDIVKKNKQEKNEDEISDNESLSPENKEIENLSENEQEQEEEEEEEEDYDDEPKRKRKKEINKENSKLEIKKKEIERIKKLRKSNFIKVYGEDVPKPIETFGDLCSKFEMNEIVLENIKQMGFDKPTAVQMQAITLMLDKRELICCAPTGSGKTIAFVLPLIIHLKEPKNCGFRAVILAPTRELAKQIHREALFISEGTGLRIHLIKNLYVAKKMFGHESHLKFDILVTTPKRLVKLLKQDPPGINIQNVEWLVIDECDKLFETDFREQLSVIYKSCSKSEKISRALFSATFDKELETWFQLNLDNVVTLIVGGKNRTPRTVEQELLYVGNEDGKMMALKDLIVKGIETPVLIFVDNVEKAKTLTKQLILDGIKAEVMHSDRTQNERDNIVRMFREGKIWFLVSTELMGRGIDFKGVNIIINYDFPQSTIAYIHRIGRTGRAGRKGKAITFYTNSDIKNIRSVVNVMRISGAKIPPHLIELATKSSKKVWKGKGKFMRTKRKHNKVKSKDKNNKFKKNK